MYRLHCPLTSVQANAPLALDVHIALSLPGPEAGQHRRDNPAFLDKINLSLKDGWRIIIKAYDKACLHLQSCSLNTPHAFDVITVFVLFFVTGNHYDVSFFATLNDLLSLRKKLIKVCNRSTLV
ncbi:MAG: hypothetical protein ACK41Q_09130 [Candidatus Brocadia sp.]